MLDLKKLQVFIFVLEHRSFSKAAELSHITQPTVSGHIKALEEYFGVTLFNRHTRDVVPTPAGLLLHRYAKRIVRLLEEMEREVAYYKDGRKGKLFLGASTIPGQYILPKILTGFKKIYPRIQISVKIADTNEIVRLVAEGELELGVVGAKVVETSLFYEPCHEDEIILVVGRDFEIGGKEQLELEEIKNIPLIAREKGSGTWLTAKKALKEAGCPLERLNIVAELGSTEAVRQAVKTGLGGAFLSWHAVAEDVASGLLKEIQLKGLSIRRNFYIVIPEKRMLSPTVQLFMEFFRSESQKMYHPSIQGGKSFTRS